VRGDNDGDGDGAGAMTTMTTTTMGVATLTTTTMWTLICKSSVHFYSLYYIHDVYGSLLSTMPDRVIFNEKKKVKFQLVFAWKTS
jgi:hypothetical protein